MPVEGGAPDGYALGRRRPPWNESDNVVRARARGPSSSSPIPVPTLPVE